MSDQLQEIDHIAGEARNGIRSAADLTALKELEVQVLLEREPLAGASVVAVPERDPLRGYRRATTGDDGQARFKLDKSGLWAVHVVHKRPAAKGGAASGIVSSSLVLIAGPLFAGGNR